ncbi:BnaCnng78010D [Brassica napus]|uniref:BnaCnng78010D protein n=1 Tax=Brassica napus TaxID=3708 RepID=A0A078K0N9_BRANA|nr:BnaCnng78010D [Brassica napus]
MSFLGHFQVLVFLYALLLFLAESRKIHLFDTESSADDGAEHENYGDKIDARDIPLLYLETKIQNAPVGSPQRQEMIGTARRLWLKVSRINQSVAAIEEACAH